MKIVSALLLLAAGLATADDDGEIIVLFPMNWLGQQSLSASHLVYGHTWFNRVFDGFTTVDANVCSYSLNFLISSPLS